MKLLIDRLKKLEKQQNQGPNAAITKFRVLDQDDREAHDAEMVANGYRLVSDNGMFQVWDGPD